MRKGVRALLFRPKSAKLCQDWKMYPSCFSWNIRPMFHFGYEVLSIITARSPITFSKDFDRSISIIMRLRPCLRINVTERSGNSNQDRASCNWYHLFLPIFLHAKNWFAVICFNSQIEIGSPKLLRILFLIAVEKPNSFDSLSMLYFSFVDSFSIIRSVKLWDRSSQLISRIKQLWLFFPSSPKPQHADLHWSYDSVPLTLQNSMLWGQFFFH